MSWVFIAWAIPMIIGGAFLAYLKYTKSSVTFIPWTGVVVGVVLWFCAWGIVALGTHMSVQSAVTFHENWGGFEVAAVKDKTTCHEDGACVHEYDCDPYEVKVVDRAAYTDDKNVYHAEVSHMETRYHSCPYTTEEWTFVVQTTLGDYTIASHWLPENPDEHRWRSGHNVPDGRFPSGTPKFWEQARQRIAAGDPGPVTKRMDYENYILASQNTILKQYSDSIERYRKAKLLPALSHDPVQDPYYENKVFFEGVTPPGNWQYALNQFDAALGMDLQGDAYLVIVDANKVTDADDYMIALSAYWSSEKYFGKDAISKNGIIIVVGTKDGKTVDWARAKTGMPVGNEAMILDVRNTLPGTALTPDALLGHPRAARLYKKPGSSHYSVDIAHTNGALERVLWGEHKFERVCMTCSDPGETGKVGYEYLKNEIQPSGAARFWMDFFTLLVGLGLWFAAFYVSDPSIVDSIAAPRSRRW